MRIVVIDGQGGKLGRAIVEQILLLIPDATVVAVGTNSTATAAMMKAGAEFGATGENPVKVNVAKADYIIGPVGIVLADSLFGEVTPAMAAAVASCDARKILIAYNKCNTTVVTCDDREPGLGEYVKKAVRIILEDGNKGR